MICNFKSWILTNKLSAINNELLDDILEKLCYIINEPKITFLLDTKNINSILEKLILDIATFHVNELKKSLNENIFIEFWFKKYENNDNNNFHIDCDEYDKLINKSENCNTPLLSCVTYLNDNDNNPTLITDVDKETYKYKQFDNKKICLSLPRKMKQITFNGSDYYHTECKLSFVKDAIRNILVINIWDKKPLNVPTFNYEYFSFKYTMNKKIELGTIFFNKDDIIFNVNKKTDKTAIININNNYILSQQFFENILYQDNFNCLILNEYINKVNENKLYDTFLFEKSEIETCEKKSILDTSNISKFNQRFIKNKHFTNDICKWIIYESESYASTHTGWTTNRHNNYPTTDLEIENISSIFSFILISFKETISKEIIKNYSLNEDIYSFEIVDLFIVKYEMNNQRSLNIHDDLCCITANILLSDINDFKGGGTYFEDDITVHLNQGDMIIHSGKCKHAGAEITEGKRYVLVFFINILHK